jgi:hypothetical protein
MSSTKSMVNMELPEEFFVQALKNAIDKQTLDSEHFAKELVEVMSNSNQLNALAHLIFSIRKELTYKVGDYVYVNKNYLGIWSADHEKNKQEGIYDKNDLIHCQIYKVEKYDSHPYRVEFSYYRNDRPEIYKSTYVIPESFISGPDVVKNVNLGEIL